MALGVGIASAIGGRHSKENSFGLIALCSVGPILAVLILGLTGDGSLTFVDPEYAIAADGLGSQIFETLLDVAKEVAIALGLIVAFFIVLNFTVLHVPKKQLKRMAVGIGYTYLGLVIFLASVSVGFMPIGYKIGKTIAAFSHEILIAFGFILGAAVVLAEPAVHVLNRQVEEITDGTVSRRSMMIALSVGVGISICLSMIRIVFQFSLLYYIVPGYLISLGLSLFVPKIYTAIAFDSGGVASGPLTSGFILPLAIGASLAVGGNVMSDAFGIVAMVAMTPLITIQLLGFRAVMSRKVREKIAMRRILESDDARIIDFM